MNATRRDQYDDPRRNERDLAYIVELPVPEGGFGFRLHDILDWHRTRFMEPRRGYGHYAEGVWYVRWCFREARDADDFKVRFGGALVAPRRKAGRAFRA